MMNPDLRWLPSKMQRFFSYPLFLFLLGFQQLLKFEVLFLGQSFFEAYFSLMSKYLFHLLSSNGLPKLLFCRSIHQFVLVLFIYKMLKFTQLFLLFHNIQIQISQDPKSMSSLYSQKSSPSISQRLFMVSQKINQYNSPNRPSDTLKKYQQLDSQCDQLQNQLQQFKSSMSQELYDVNSLVKFENILQISKIERETNYDHHTTDQMLRQKIETTSQKMFAAIQQQNQIRKSTDNKIIHYIQQEIMDVKTMIDKQGKIMQQQSQSISQSLAADFQEIKDRVQNVVQNHRSFSQLFEQKLQKRLRNLKQRICQANDKYIENQAECYKAMRQIFKKVKQQLQQQQQKRQSTQNSILMIIENLCDKAIQKQQQ